MIRPMKSNDLGALLESEVREALAIRGSVFWRLPTIRSFRGVSNPCDFLVLDPRFIGLIECKATNDDKLSCASLRQLPHLELGARIEHSASFGVLAYFYGENPKYVYVSDRRVVYNKKCRRPIRPTVPESYSYIAESVGELLNQIGN